jgi:hypothetical protein
MTSFLFFFGLTAHPILFLHPLQDQDSFINMTLPLQSLVLALAYTVSQDRTI